MGQGENVLGIDVTGDMLDQWRSWLMPAEQPFLVPRAAARAAGLTDDRPRLSPELTDSFWLYDVGDQAVCWLTKAGTRCLPAEVRRSQPAAHRWPCPDRNHDVTRVIRVVESGHRRSCHADVTEATWATVSRILPAARELAGRFPSASGPNCFGTVMGAAGVTGAAGTWMQREPFEAWLAAQSRPGGSYDQAGTVLVWRDDNAEVQHAAVTLGDGWALHKQSQAWMSPTAVLTVRDAILSARFRGHHLRRHKLIRHH